MSSGRAEDFTVCALPQRWLGVDRGEMTPDDERRAIGEVIDRIAGRLPGLPRPTIEAEVEENLKQFDGRPIRDFVPLFVERASVDSLAAQAPTVAPSAAVLDLPDAPAAIPGSEVDEDSSGSEGTLRTMTRPLTGRRQPRHASRPRQMSNQD